MKDPAKSDVDQKDNTFAKVTGTNTDEYDHADYRVFSKTFIVEISHANSNSLIKGYAILDNQSTRCFADSKLIDLLDIETPNHSYSIETLSGLATNV